jgi:hypothetical protein
MTKKKKKRVGQTAAVTAGAATRDEAKTSTWSRPTTTRADRSASTSITIAPEDWALLRAVAFARTQRSGGRASVSAVIGELIDQARSELIAEAGKFYGD